MAQIGAEVFAGRASTTLDRGGGRDVVCEDLTLELR
jgi:hypothetical protein